MHLHHRIRLQPQNIAFLLQAQTNRLRQSLLQQEPSRLKSSNKIHNFTTHELPADFINLLNKRTNFIPTLDNCNSNTCKKTITEKVNSALCQTIRKSSSTTSLIQRRTKTRRTYKPYNNKNPLKLLKDHQLKPNFNFHVIDYVTNTAFYTKEYLKSANFHNIYQARHLNIAPSVQSQINKFTTREDLILTKSDKNMGWALVPISWFHTEYKRHFKDSTTYHRIDNFNLNATISKSKVFLGKLKKRFTKSFQGSVNTELLTSTSCDTYQQPYMKLLPKIHKLHHPASPDNLDQLTGRSIITAHSWITSKPSRLLGEELDKLIFQMRDIFKHKQIKFPLLYNSL